MKNTIIASSLAAVALIAGGYALIHTSARADVASQPITTSVSVSQDNTDKDVKGAQDTDNVQDENGGPEKPDTTVNQDTDKETNDDSTQGVAGKTSLTQGQDLPENSNDAPDSQ